MDRPLNKYNIADLLDISPPVARNRLGDKELGLPQKGHIETILEKYRENPERMWETMLKEALRNYALEGFNVAGYCNEYSILKGEANERRKRSRD